MSDANEVQSMPDETLIVSLREPKTPETPEATESVKSAKRRRGMRGLVALAVILLALAAGGGWYLFSTGKAARMSGAGTPAAATQAVGTSTNAGTAEAAGFVKKVGALIDLPQGETPTVATVTDPKKLAGQPFFANAKAGDVVLIYTKAREAYLYDPSRNKLVQVAPITTGAAAVPQGAVK